MGGEKNKEREEGAKQGRKWKDNVILVGHSEGWYSFLLKVWSWQVMLEKEGGVLSDFFLVKTNGAGVFPNPSQLQTLEGPLNQKGDELMSVAISRILTTRPGGCHSSYKASICVPVT